MAELQMKDLRMDDFKFLAELVHLNGVGWAESDRARMCAIIGRFRDLFFANKAFLNIDNPRAGERGHVDMGAAVSRMQTAVEQIMESR